MFAGAKPKILDAAEKIMSQKGLEGSSIGELARSAGVTFKVNCC